MSEDDFEKSELEVLRENNVKERNAFLSTLLDNPEFTDVINAINSANERENTERPISRSNSIRRKRVKSEDTVFRFGGAIPNERRSSARLQNRKPDYTYLDLPEDRKDVSGIADSLEDLEEVVYEVKKKRKSSKDAPYSRIIPVEEVTETMIKNIHLQGNKVYDALNGSSCHQCRQKTRDQKTICRSGYCVGVRGQFCGICVKIRYGEDPAEVLKDPKWKCYVCRGNCNCSFCRLKAGKRPTGILAPLAMRSGYKSVADFLTCLKGYGDYSEDNSDNLLGFDGPYAVMGGNIKEMLSLCEFDVDYSDPKNLKGFDGGYAVMGDSSRVLLACQYDTDYSNNKNLLGFVDNCAITVGGKINLKCEYDCLQLGLP